MDNNVLSLTTPAAYIERCLGEIIKAINMASFCSEYSSNFSDGLKEIQLICEAGLKKKSVSARKKALKDIGNQALWLEDSALPERVLTCLDRIQLQVGRGLNAKSEIAASRKQILS